MHSTLRSTAVVLACAGAALTAACAGNRSTADASGLPEDVIRPAAIEAHMRYLASDLMEGREAGTRGYDLAAGYVASQFQLLGLRPAGQDGSFYQPVPLQAHWLEKDASRLIVRPARGPASRLTLGTDFVVSSSPSHPTSSVAAPAVFVGYGITAPEFDHDDYAGLDVSGQIVVLFAGFPASLPGEEGAHYGSSRTKGPNAAAHGAIGIVTIYTERYEGVRPWDRVTADLDSMSMTWAGPDGAPFEVSPGIQVSAVMSPASGAMLFDGAERSYQEVRAEAASGAPAGFPLAVSLEMAQGSRHERRSSANVAAVLEGGDPALRGEYVVVLGHLDHEGIGPAVNGDGLYNGALDNAAGIAAMLEAARAVTSAATKPRRSILFLAVTAEEKGLIGSDYFARHPTVPREHIVAAVNLDMPVLLYTFTDVIAFGAEHSSLKGIVETALVQTGLTLTPDPMPEQTIFTRSDHYRFVQQGIPAVYLATGWNSSEGVGEGGLKFQRFLATDYHRPSDDLSQPIDYAAGAKFAYVNAVILKAIADADSRPTWNDGDFFGNLFAQGD